MQSCTELILPTEANNKESIFPVSTYNYTATAESCEAYYGVAPRQHWITTEFGGKVSVLNCHFLIHA